MFALFFIVLWLTVLHSRYMKYRYETYVSRPFLWAFIVADLVTWLVWLFIYNFG